MCMVGIRISDHLGNRVLWRAVFFPLLAVEKRQLESLKNCRFFCDYITVGNRYEMAQGYAKWVTLHT
jgi:hypothetical protein